MIAIKCLRLTRVKSRVGSASSLDGRINGTSIFRMAESD